MLTEVVYILGYFCLDQVLKLLVISAFCYKYKYFTNDLISLRVKVKFRTMTYSPSRVSPLPTQSPVHPHFPSSLLYHGLDLSSHTLLLIVHVPGILHCMTFTLFLHSEQNTLPCGIYKRIVFCLLKSSLKVPWLRIARSAYKK